MQGKTVAQSEVVLMRTLLPNETNSAGLIHGGYLLQYIDGAAALVARRHARGNVATASLERMDFLTPMRPGDVLLLKACLHMVGRTSMEIGVEVDIEDIATETVRHAASCYLTFVALDGAGKPTPVPPLILSNDLERKRFEAAQERRQQRLAMQA
jgi:acyl-CoA hydrolase